MMNSERNRVVTPTRSRSESDLYGSYSVLGEHQDEHNLLHSPGLSPSKSMALHSSFRQDQTWSPTKTEVTDDTREESSFNDDEESSNSTWNDISSDEDDDDSSCCCSLSSLLILDIPEIDNDDDTSTQVMPLHEMIHVLEQVNREEEESTPPGGFLTNETPPSPLMIEELTDLLCHVNTNDCNIQWNVIYNVVHRKQESSRPLEHVDVLSGDDSPNNLSTCSSVSTGSARDEFLDALLAASEPFLIER